MEFNNGYIKLYRSLLDWGWWGSVKTRDVFIYLLLAANWEDKRWQGIWIRRGQLLTSRAELARAVGITEGATREALKRLKSTNEITIDTTNQRSLITIVNYEKYQANDVKTTNETTNNTTTEQPTNNQRTTTTEKDKNIRTINNNNIRRFSPPSVEEVRAYCLERQNNVDPQHFIDHYQSNGWKVGKNPMKDWKASVRNWEKNSMSTPKIDNKPKKYTRPEDYL